MDSKQKVQIFSTGGTIEKSYCEADGSITNLESQMREKLLRRLRLPHTVFCVTEIMSKDSLDMTDEDRQTIFETVQSEWSNGVPIVVLHGTDTMEKTLQHCYQQKSKPAVAVIFTGAMKPAGFDDTDALQNFTEALYAAQIVPPGFYISFHGRLFDAPNVTKNKAAGTFEETY